MQLMATHQRSSRCLQDLATSLAKQQSGTTGRSSTSSKTPLVGGSDDLGNFFTRQNQSSNALVSKVAEQLYETIRQGQEV